MIVQLETVNAVEKVEVNTYYIYRHIRLDTNTPFYVGKGKGYRAYKLANS